MLFTEDFIRPNNSTDIKDETSVGQEEQWSQYEAGILCSTAENCSQTRVWLESYGVSFPDQQNLTSSTCFCLSPNTPEEEEEQLCMAKQLSLSSVPFNTEQTKEAANILLFFKLQRNGNETLTLCTVFYLACVLK